MRRAISSTAPGFGSLWVFGPPLRGPLGFPRAAIPDRSLPDGAGQIPPTDDAERRARLRLQVARESCANTARIPPPGPGPDLLFLPRHRGAPTIAEDMRNPDTAGSCERSRRVPFA